MNENVFEFIRKEKKENVRFLQSKKNSYIMINNPSFVNGFKDYNRIHMYDNKGIVAELQYGFINVKNNKHVYLFNISILEKENLGKGLGSYLIKFLEEVALKKGYNKVEGELYLKPPATKEQVENFYIRNGYETLEIEGDKPIVSKILSYENLDTIKNNTSNYAFGYQMYGKLENFKTSENINIL
jgi:GNAT superfamily N-acetyltransferase